MRDANLRALKFALADIDGIETLTQANVGGRMVFGFGVSAASTTIGVDPAATDDQIIAAIRKAAEAKQPAPAPAAPQPKDTTMSTPAPGGFAASLRAMMDEARAGVAKARSDGLAQVQTAVGKLAEAKDATVKVAGNTAKMIEDEAAATMAELGQLSNDL